MSRATQPCKPLAKRKNENCHRETERHGWTQRGVRPQPNRKQKDRGLRGYARMGEMTSFVFIRAYPRNPRSSPFRIFSNSTICATREEICGLYYERHESKARW